MSRTRTKFPIRPGVFTIFYCRLFYLTHAVIYQDFDDDWSPTVLKHGVLYIGNNIGLLDKMENNKQSLQFEFFFVDLQYRSYDGMDDVVEFCGNYDRYLKGKRVLLRIHHKALEFFADCLKNSSELENNEELQRLTLLTTYSSDLNAQVQKLKTMSVGFGLVMSNDTFYEENHDMFSDMQLLHDQVQGYALYVEYSMDEGSFLYDYNTLAEMLNKEYTKLVRVLPRFKNDIIMELNMYWDCLPSAEAYKSLISRFLYQWGEQAKQRVVFRSFIGQNTTDLNSRFFSRPTSQSFMLTLAGGPRDQNYLMMLTNQDYSKEFNSVLLDITSNVEIGYKNLVDIANSTHLKGITMNLMWKQNYSSALEAQNMTHLLSLNPRYPNLFKNIFVVLTPPHGWKAEVDSLSLQMNETVTVLKTLSMTLNISLTFLVPGTTSLSEIEVEKYAEEFSGKHFNASTGFYVPIENSSLITPTFLNELAKGFLELGKTSVLIELPNWKTSAKEEFGGCYECKKYFNMVKNWADVHSYSVAVSLTQRSSSFQNSQKVFTKPWHKSESLFGSGYNLSQATRDELKFLSNSQDTCVATRKDTPTKPVKFSAENAGSTINFISGNHLNLKPLELAQLFELIHFQFSSSEIIVKHPDQLSAITEAIRLVHTNTKNDHDDASESTSRYYLNIGLLDSSMFNSYDIFSGAHLTFCGCKNDQEILRNLRKAALRNSGISISYDEALNVTENDSLKYLIPLFNYTVIRVNLAKELLMTSHNSAYQGNNLNTTFHRYIKYRKYDMHPNPVFDRIRAMRFNLRRIKPNMTVYMQISWPTTEDKRSIGRTLKLWDFLNDFSTVFHFPFFLYEAFDGVSDEDNKNKTELKYGWWKLMNESDVGNVFNYVDKQAEFFKMETLRPSKVIKTETKEMPSSFPLIEIVIGVATIFLVIICAGAVFIYRLRKTVQMMLTKEELQQFELGNLGSAAESERQGNDYCTVAYNRKKYEISKCAFNFDSSTLLGSGFFGFVYKSTIPNHDKPVAIKVPKISGKLELLSVLREIKLMSFVGEHENVLKLVGAYTKEIQKGIVYVITEICDHGSLLDYLRKLDNAEKAGRTVLLELHEFCLEISRGMQFLAEKKVIHGDLSTRNVLLDENNICKICDFGLSRKLYDMDLYVKSSVEPVPWKWMAIETLERSELSLKSDIWSLGVTFWEIFSFGEEPYQSLSWDLEFSKKLIGGLRLPKPAIAEIIIYEKMLSCWEINPEERPSAEDFVGFFQSLRNLSYTHL